MGFSCKCRGVADLLPIHNRGFRAPWLLVPGRGSVPAAGEPPQVVLGSEQAGRERTDSVSNVIVLQKAPQSFKWTSCSLLAVCCVSGKDVPRFLSQAGTSDSCRRCRNPAGICLQTCVTTMHL